MSFKIMNIDRRRLFTLIPVSFLEKAALKLKCGRTYVDICSRVPIEGVRLCEKIKISRKTLQKAYKHHGMKVPLGLPGRPHIEFPQEFIEAIEDFRSRYRCGVTKTYYRLLCDPYFLKPGKMSYRMVYRYFQQRRFLSYEIHPRQFKYRCRYEATSVLALVHTDLHQLHNTQQYVIGFIDDKSATSTSAELYKMLMKYPDISHLMSDNGREFLGSFQDTLREFQVTWIHTKPYNPESNGKIERFWQTLAKNYTRLERIEEFVYEYNRVPHASLKNTGSRPMTPLEVFEDPEIRWTRGTPAMWIVDSELKPIP
jgi:hypothetical protein